MKQEKLYIYANKYPRKAIQQDVSIGHRLKLIRLTLDLWQTDIAKRFKVSQSTIKNFENNLHRTSHEMLLAYASLAGVTVDWILTGRAVSIRDRTFLIRAKKRRRHNSA